MRKADYRRHRDRVRALNEKWTYALGFRWWRHFEIRYYARRRDLPKAHRSRAGWDTVMWTTVRWDYLDAVIHVNVPAVARETEKDLEYIWLHELCHVAVNQMRPEGGSTPAELRNEELVCTRLAQMFLWIARDRQGSKPVPMKSKAQRRYLHAKKPQLAEEFEAATPKGAKLPEKAPKKGKGSRRG